MAARLSALFRCGTTIGRRTKPPKRNSPFQRNPELQQLESRRLLTGHTSLASPLPTLAWELRQTDTLAIEYRDGSGDLQLGLQPDEQAILRVTINNMQTEARADELTTIEISGSDGDDTFRLAPIASHFIISDQGGTDTLDFTHWTPLHPLVGQPRVGVQVDLALLGSPQTLDIRDDTPTELTLLHQVEHLVGSHGNDRLFGTLGDNRFRGGLGDDLLVGRGGNDSYLLSNTFSTTTIEDSQGRDTLDFSSWRDLGGAGVTIDLAQTGATPQLLFDNGNSADHLILSSGTQIEDVIGTPFSDSILGNNHDNSLEGLGGDDTIRGRDGDDRILGGPGIDSLAGEAGNDLLISESTDARVAHANRTEPEQLQGGSGDDRLVGSAGPDLFIYQTTNFGHDTIIESGDRSQQEPAISFTGPIDQIDVTASPPLSAQFSPLDNNLISDHDDRFSITVVSGRIEEIIGQPLSPPTITPQFVLPPTPTVIPQQTPTAVPITLTLPADADSNLSDWRIRLDNPPSASSFRLVPLLDTNGDVIPGGVQLLITPQDRLGPGATEIWLTATHQRFSGTLHPDSVARAQLPLLVEQSNVAPTLPPIADRQLPSSDVTATPLQLLVTATDVDAHDSLIRYELGGDAPPEASLHPVTGRFDWTNLAATIPGTYPITVTATDQGSPPLSATQTFHIVVGSTQASPRIQFPSSATNPVWTIEEDTLLSFADATVGRIAISQNAGQFGEPIDLLLAATQGLLSLPNLQLTDVEIFDGRDRDAPFLRIRGNVASLNEAIAQIDWQPATNYVGPASLRLMLQPPSERLATTPVLATADLPIVVTPKNDDAPNVAPQIFSWNAAAPTAVGGIVGHLVASDPDFHDELTFALIDSSENGDDDQFLQHFEIDSQTGELRSVSPADYGPDRMITGTVSVSDTAGNSTEATVTVIDNRPPTLSAGASLLLHWDFRLGTELPTYRLPALHQGEKIEGDSLLVGSSDFDGDRIRIASVEGIPVEYDLPVQLPSGAIVTFFEDGTFEYDSSNYQANHDYDGFVDLAEPIRDGSDDSYVPRPYANLPLSTKSEDLFWFTVSDDYGGVASGRVHVPTIFGTNQPPSVPDRHITLPRNSPVGSVVADLDSTDLDGFGLEQAYFGFADTSSHTGIVPSDVFDLKTVATPHDVMFTHPATGEFVSVQSEAAGSFSRFQPMKYTGVLTIRDADRFAQLPDDFSLSIDVWDDFSVSNPSRTDITFSFDDTGPPVASPNDYATWAEASITGNLITDDTGHGTDQVEDGATLSLRLESFAGLTLTDQTSLTLPSGAILSVDESGNGDFEYDPASSTFFSTLAHDEQYREEITYTVRDARGATATGELRIVVVGTNDLPIAFDKQYQFTIDDSAPHASGNLLTDAHEIRSDYDPDGDSLAVIEFNSAPIDAAPVTFDSGGQISVIATGEFVYTPPSDLPPNFTPYTETFTYTIGDGRPASWSRAAVELQIRPAPLFAPLSKLSISNLRPAMPSGDATSLLPITGTPTLIGMIDGPLTELDGIRIEVDPNVHQDQVATDFQPEIWQQIDIDASTTAPLEFFLDLSTREQYQLDAENTLPGLRTIAIRAVELETNSLGTTWDIGTTPWQIYAFELSNGAGSGPIRFYDQLVDHRKPGHENTLGTQGIRLDQDTGSDLRPLELTETYDPLDIADPLARNDVTTDPTITGTLLGELLAGETLEVILDFRINGFTDFAPVDRQFSHHLQIDDLPPGADLLSHRTFNVDPRQITIPDGTASQLVPNRFVGNVSIDYRFRHLDAVGTILQESEPMTYRYQVDRPNANAPSVETDSIALLRDTGRPGDRITSLPILRGNLLDSSLNNFNSLNTLPIRKIEWSISPQFSFGDDVPEGETLVNQDGTFEVTLDRINYNPQTDQAEPLLAGRYDVSLRVVAWDATDSAWIVGPWSFPFSFEFAADPPPAIAQLELTSIEQQISTFPPRPVTSQAKLNGILDLPEPTPSPHETPFLEDAPFDNSSLLQIDSSGNQPPGAQSDDQELLARVESLLADTESVEIELYFQQVSSFDLHEPGTPHAVVLADRAGNFDYTHPDLAPGTWYVWSRTRSIDPLQPVSENGDLVYVYSDWIDHDPGTFSVQPYIFEFSPAAGPEVEFPDTAESEPPNAARISTLNVEDAIATQSGYYIGATARIIGQVVDQLQRPIAQTPVEIRAVGSDETLLTGITSSDGDFQISLRELSLTDRVDVEMRAYYYSPDTQDFVPGSWSTTTGSPPLRLIPLTPPEEAAPTTFSLQGLRLVHDTGNPTDLQSARAEIAGQVAIFDAENNQFPFSVAQILFSRATTTTFEPIGIATAAPNGTFRFDAAAIPLGESTIVASLRLWDERQLAWIELPPAQQTAAITLTLSSRVDTPVVRDDGGRLLALDASYDPQKGTVYVSGQVSDDASLQNIEVELQSTLAGQVRHHFARPDRQGFFQQRIDVGVPELPAATLSIIGRTHEWDATQSTYFSTDWSDATASPHAFDQVIITVDPIAAGVTDPDLLASQEERAIAQSGSEQAERLARDTYVSSLLAPQISLLASGESAPPIAVESIAWPTSLPTTPTLVTQADWLPQAPGILPSYTGPTPQLDADPLYTSELASLRHTHQDTISAAEATRASALAIAKNRYQERLLEINRQYMLDVGRSRARFEALYFRNSDDADSPDFAGLAAELNESLTKIATAWTTFWDRLEAADSRAYEATKQVNDRFHAEWDPELDRWMYELIELTSDRVPHPEHGFTYEPKQVIPPDLDLLIYEIDKRAAQTWQRLSTQQVEQREAVRTAHLSERLALYYETIASEIETRGHIATNIVRKLASQQLIDAMSDLWILVDGEAESGSVMSAAPGLAHARYARDLARASANQTYAHALADAELTFDESTSNADFTLATSVAAAKQQATHRWAQAIVTVAPAHTPWASYQETLAAAERQRADAIAAADNQRATDNSVSRYGNAADHSAPGVAYRDAASRYDYEVALAAADRDEQLHEVQQYIEFRLAADLAYQARDEASVEAFIDRWHAWGGASLSRWSGFVEADSRRTVATATLAIEHTATVPEGQIIDENGIGPPHATNSYFALTGWAQDLYESANSGEGESQLLVDNRGTRIRTRRSVREGEMAAELNFDLTTFELEETYLHTESESHYEWELANATAELTAISEVATFVTNLETQQDVARNDRGRDHAEQFVELATALAESTSMFRQEIANTQRRRDRLVNLAISENSQIATEAEANYRIAEALTLYLTPRVAWRDAQQGWSPLEQGWSNYQVAIAQAEVDRVMTLADAEIAAANANFARSARYSDETTDVEYDREVHAVNREKEFAIAMATADASLQFAKSNLSSSSQHLGPAKSDAITQFDQRAAELTFDYTATIAEATRTQAQEETSARLNRNRAMSQAVAALQFESIAATFAHAAEEEGSDGNIRQFQRQIADAQRQFAQATSESRVHYLRERAIAARSGALARVDARRDWSDKVAPLRLALLEDLTSLDLDARQQLRERSLDYASQLANAHFQQDVGIAQTDRDAAQQLATILATDTMRATEIDAQFNVAGTILLQQSETARMEAQKAWESHAANLLVDATAAHEAHLRATGSSQTEIVYANLATSNAMARHLATQLREVADLARREREAKLAIERTQQQQLLLQSTATTISQADLRQQLAEADHYFEFQVGEAESAANLLESLSIAEVQRKFNSNGLAPTVDLLTARAVTTGSLQRARIWHDWARQFIVTQTELAALPPTSEFRSYVHAYSNHTAAISQNRDLRIAQAELDYAASLLHPYADLNLPLHEALIDYAEQTGAARVAHAERQLANETRYAARATQTESRWASDTARAEQYRAEQLATVSATFFTGIGASSRTHAAAIAEIDESLANSLAAAEASYVIAVSGAISAELTLFATTSPSTANLLRALVADADADAFASLAPDVIEYRQTLAAAAAAESAALAIADDDRLAAHELATNEYLQNLKREEATRVKRRAAVEQDSLARDRQHELSLQLAIEQASAKHAVATAEANAENGYDFDQAWEEYLLPAYELAALVQFRDRLVEIGDPFQSVNPEGSDAWYLEIGIPAAIVERIGELVSDRTPERFFYDDLIGLGTLDLPEISPAQRRRNAENELGTRERDAAIASADEAWLRSVAAAGRDYRHQLAVNQRKYSLAESDLEQAFLLAEADAALTRDSMQLQADADRQIAAQRASGNVTVDSALADRSLTTAYHAADLARHLHLDAQLAAPWTEFNVALASAKYDTLVQQDAAHLATLQEIRETQLQETESLYQESITSFASVGQEWLSFQTTLATLTQGQQAALADAEYAYQVGLADLEFDYRISRYVANDEPLATSTFQSGYRQTVERRWQEIGHARQTFVDSSTAIYLTQLEAISSQQTSEVVAQATLTRNAHVHIASFERDYLLAEAEQFVNSLAATSVSSELTETYAYYLAEAVARNEDWISVVAPATAALAAERAESEYSLELSRANARETKRLAQATASTHSLQADAGSLLDLTLRSAAETTTPRLPDSEHLLEPPRYPLLEMTATLDVFNFDDDRFEIDVLERVPPQFLTHYVYGHYWLPTDAGLFELNSHEGKLANIFHSYGQAIFDYGKPATLDDVVESGLPGLIHPFGPGQLDDLTLARNYVASSSLTTPPIYKEATQTWSSESTGVGNWENSAGFGYRYTYVPAKFFEAVRLEQPEPDKFLLTTNFGSFRGATHTEPDDAVEKELSRTNDQFVEWIADPGLIAAAGTHWKIELERRDQLPPSRPLHPSDYLPQHAPTLQTLRTSHDDSRLTIDPRSAAFALTGTNQMPPAPIAATGSSLPMANSSGEPSAMPRIAAQVIEAYRDREPAVRIAWSPRDVQHVLAQLAGHEAQFAQEFAVEFRPSSQRLSTIPFFSGIDISGPSFDLVSIPRQSSNEVARPLQEASFRELTGKGLSEAGLAALERGRVKLVIEAPASWNAVEVANYFVQVLRGDAGHSSSGLAPGALARLYENDFQQRLLQVGSDVTVAEARELYRQRVRRGMDQAAAAADLFYRSLVEVTPGGDAVLLVADLEEGNALAALLGVVTLSPISRLFRPLGDRFVFRFADNSELIVTREIREQLAQLSPQQLHSIENALTEVVPDKRGTVVRHYADFFTEKVAAKGRLARERLRYAMGALPVIPGHFRPTEPIPGDVRLAAHHIFPVQLFDGPIGRRMKRLGINLNGIENGVLLPTKDFPGRIASIHAGNHKGRILVDGEEFESYFSFAESNLLRATSREELIQALNSIRARVLDGSVTLKISN